MYGNWDWVGSCLEYFQDDREKDTSDDDDDDDEDNTVFTLRAVFRHING